MARKDALLKLYQTLKNQRTGLERKLSMELSYAGDDSGHGDSGDLANSDTEQEMHSQLAALESRELARIEKAMEAIRNGVYGTCEYCSQQIPIARLKALPHTSSCVKCQRLHEDLGFDASSEADWESAFEFQARQDDRDLSLKDFQLP